MNGYPLMKRKTIPFVVSLMELLAIRLSGKTAKSLVMSNHDRNKCITFEQATHSSTGRAIDLVRVFIMTLLLALSSLFAAAQAAELGRLFFTPEQRNQLEFQQATVSSGEGGSNPFIVVNGVVQKRGGNRTVWINGASQPGGRSDEKTPSTVPVTLPGKPQPVPVKVGQRLLLDRPAQNSAP